MGPGLSSSDGAGGELGPVVDVDDPHTIVMGHLIRGLGPQTDLSRRPSGGAETLRVTGHSTTPKVQTSPMGQNGAQSKMRCKVPLMNVARSSAESRPVSRNAATASA